MALVLRLWIYDGYIYIIWLYYLIPGSLKTMASNDASDYNAEESVQTGMCFLSFDCLIMVIYFA